MSVKFILQARKEGRQKSERETREIIRQKETKQNKENKKSWETERMKCRINERKEGEKKIKQRKKKQKQ